MSDGLTHFDKDGRAQMVDVSAKAETERAATARGRVVFSKTSYDIIRSKGVKKGDIAAVAELAGIMATKRTADLIPLCHPLPITGVSITVTPDDETQSYRVEATVKTTGKTGVEMEALTAVSAACLTIYDMTKAVDKSITIEDIALVKKSGGKSGDFVRL